MTVFFDARQNCWVYDFREGGKRFNRRAKNPDGTPAQSKRQAQAAEDAARVAARLDQRHALARPGEYTLAQAVAARAAEAKHLRSWRDARIELAEILQFFGAATPIADVADRWRDYRNWARAQTVKIWIGGPAKKSQTHADASLWRDTGRVRAPARVNRCLAQLSAVLRLAHATRGADRRPLLDFMPAIEPLPVERRDPNPVPRDVLARIEADPATPDHLWQAAALVRLFGFRLDEVFSATADRIDRDNRGYRLTAAGSKSKRDDWLPANDEAMQLLEWLALLAAERAETDGKEADTTHLIVYRATPEAPARAIKNPRRAWRTALKRLGLEGVYRFHDLRASYVTAIAHVASSAVTQRLARHASAATTARYTRIADSAARAAVEQMGRGPTQSPDAVSRSPQLRRIK